MIREFLKKNGFDRTYDLFMKEDTRPKVTMTKIELTKLLGVEALVKRNSKSKQFDTMLDTVCNFLVLSKDVGGVDLPQATPGTAQVKAPTASVAVPVSKAIS